MKAVGRIGNQRNISEMFITHDFDHDDISYYLNKESKVILCYIERRG